MSMLFYLNIKEYDCILVWHCYPNFRCKIDRPLSELSRSSAFNYLLEFMSFGLRLKVVATPLQIVSVSSNRLTSLSIIWKITRISKGDNEILMTTYFWWQRYWCWFLFCPPWFVYKVKVTVHSCTLVRCETIYTAII